MLHQRMRKVQGKACLPQFRVELNNVEGSAGDLSAEMKERKILVMPSKREQYKHNYYI